MILYILGGFPVKSERFIAREITALRSAGVSITVAALRPGADSANDIPLLPTSGIMTRIGSIIRSPVTAFRILYRGMVATRGNARNLLYFLYAWPKLVAWLPRLRRSGIKRVHAPFASVPGLCGSLLAAELTVPFSFTAHAYDLFTPKSMFGKLYPVADVVATVCQANLQYIEKTWGPAAAEKTLVVYNGLTADEIVIRDRGSDRLQIMTAGRLVAKKGIDSLVRVMTELLKQHSGLTLVISGDGPERAALNELVQQMNIQNSVRFTGWRERGELQTLFSESRIFVLPCCVGPDGDRDGLPTVLMEAMAAGIPVVSSPVAGIPELITNGHDGFLADNERKLAAAILTLLGDTKLRERMGENGQRTIRDRFLIDRTIQPLRQRFQNDER